MDYEIIDILEWLVDELYGSCFSSKNLPISPLIEYDLKDLLDILEHYDGHMHEGTRSKNAAYFTPLWLCDLMVDEMVDEYFEGKTIIDLACGSGNLLKSYILKACDAGLNVNNVLECVYGVDINVDAVRALKLNVYVSLVENGYEDFDVNLMNLFVCDSLIDFEPGFKFDYCIGNPPYIGEKNNKELFRSIKETSFGKRYYEGKMDYFYFFIYKGYSLLKDSGRGVYLTTNYYLKADGAKKLRHFMESKKCLVGLIDFGEQRVFKDAKGQHNLITIFDRSESEEVSICHYPDDAFDVTRDWIFNGKFLNMQMYSTVSDYGIMHKIRDKCNNVLSDSFSVNQGIVSGADKLSKKNSELLGLLAGSSVFVLESDEISKFEGTNSLKRFYKNSDLGKYKVYLKSSKYILYDNLDHPMINAHLLPYKETLQMRREVQLDRRKWFELTWPRTKEIFENEKIVVPQRSLTNTFAYSNGALYGSADIYYIQKLPLGFVDMKYLLGYLNSSLVYYYLYNGGKRKGDMLELYATPLKELPLPILELDDQEIILGYVDEMINEGYSRDMQRRIDEIFFIHFEFCKEEIMRIEELYYE